MIPSYYEPDFRQCMLCACWCAQDFIHVPVRLIREGKMVSCGREGCQEMVRS